MNPTQTLTLLAHVHPHTGYGQHTAQTVRWLEELHPGLQVKIRPLDVMAQNNAVVPGDLRSKLVYERQPGDCELIIAPLRHAPTPERQSVYFTMTESTGMTRQAVDWLNECSQVITPSQWNAAIFSAAGVTKPVIMVVPLGIDPTIWKLTDLPVQSDVTVFGAAGCLAHGEKRKGLSAVLDGFQKAFQGRDDVRLQLKVMPHEKLSDSSFVGDPRISFERGFLTEGDLAKWMAQCHCWINLASGGWELFVHQAMALGRPVISMFFGGQTEYFNELCGYVVEHFLTPAKEGWPGLWAAPYEEAFIAALRYAEGNHHSLHTMGFAAHQSVRRLTWEHSVKKLVYGLTRDGVLRASPPVPIQGGLMKLAKDYDAWAERVEKGLDRVAVVEATADTAGVVKQQVRAMKPLASPEAKMEVLKQAIKPRWNTKPLAILCLGRLGDCTAALPIAMHYAEKLGQPVDWIVSKEYARLFEKVDYVRPVIFAGEFFNTGEARKQFARHYEQLIDAQSFTLDEPPFVPLREDFVQEAFSRAGVSHLFGRTALVLERKERAVWPKEGKPVLLISTDGTSSPYPHQKALHEAVRRLGELGAYRVLDLSRLVCPNPADLLAIMENARAAILTDSFPLHLSYAVPWLKVAALVADSPTEWHGTPMRPNWFAWNRYGGSVHVLESMMDHLLNAVDEVQAPKLIHLVQGYQPKDPETQCREKIAATVWDIFYRAGLVQQVTFHAKDFPNARQVGDESDAPNVKAVLDRASENNLVEDILLFTNSDVFPTVEALGEIRQAVRRFGCFYSKRVDVERLDRPPFARSVAGQVYPGADLFAFTGLWWRQWREMVPDLYMGKEGWDGVMKILMRETGFRPGQPVILHEKHASKWITDPDSPAQRHNRETCLKWAHQHGYQRHLLKNSRFVFGAI